MTLRVGLVGLGTVGQAVARRILDGAGRRVKLVRVCGRANGRPRPGWLPGAIGWTTSFDALLAPDVDVVVELVGGIQPARHWAQRALLAGKSYVTANKQLVAEHGPELLALASSQRRSFRFEAAVAGGIPIVRAVEDGLSGDRLVAIDGILNGTCNYVLSRIERAGIPFGEALREAQAKGFAEADPTADIEGHDARAKLAILCAVAFGERVRTSDIACGSIASVSPDDFARARQRGCTIRQVSSAARTGDGVVAAVKPTLVPLDSPFARAEGAQNVVAIRGEFGGETVFAGQGAGGDPTAVAVISDLLAVARREPVAHPGVATRAAATGRRRPAPAPGLA